MKNKTVTVCMAVYNGEKFLLEQIYSILYQLDDDDEVIIVNDNSSDSSIELINSIKDPRIKLLHNKTNLGVNKSFEIAIGLSSKEYIFMADQDDIWFENRVETMIKYIGENIKIVNGNQQFIDQNGNKIEYNLKTRFSSDNRLMRTIFKIVIGRAHYYGCTMGFSADMKSIILPFPKYIESHDMWIALIGIISRNISNLEEVVLHRRIHQNLSLKQRSIYKKLKSRIILVLMIFQIKIRLKGIGSK
jgi:glycosyltransferase involved in cell wall biosynthesis